MATFRFVDLFAGIGGFHAALSSLGGECVYAVESDKAAAAVYLRNWGIDPMGDLTHDANDETMNVPEHDVLVAGFPCQPFSKSGTQKGMDEARGTLFWNILRVIRARKPEIVLLENVHNLAGQRHVHEWQTIVETLRDQGYWVSSESAVFSPHLLPPSHGGRPQHRPRVFITGTRVPASMADDLRAVSPPPLRAPVLDWDPQSWRIEDWLDDENDVLPGLRLTPADQLALNAWADFVDVMRERLDERNLPGFPLWADTWHDSYAWPREPELPPWKQVIVIKNCIFYAAHRQTIDQWLERWGILTDRFPASRRKLEWQGKAVAQVYDTILQFRPSGIRCKPATYLPALVAMTQTSIVGSRHRRLSAGEAARMQGLPDTFDFGNQRAALTFKQLGNGVNVGVVRTVLAEHVRRDGWLLRYTPAGNALVEAVLKAPLAGPGDMSSVGGETLANVIGDIAACGVDKLTSLGGQHVVLGNTGRGGDLLQREQMELPLFWEGEVGLTDTLADPYTRAQPS